MWTSFTARLGLPGLVLLAMAAGCATSSDRIARYVVKHPERPSAICTALNKRTVCVGMTQKEVRLSLGAPNRVDHAGTAKAPTEIWQYFHDRDKERDARSSSFWALDVPRATIYFSSNELVEEAIFYTSSGPREPKRNVREELKPVLSEVPQKPRLYSPEREELYTPGWPKLELSGVSVMGKDCSAILNNEVFAPGETVKGIKVTDVYANGALLEYRGVRAFLRIGEATQ